MVGHQEVELGDLFGNADACLHSECIAGTRVFPSIIHLEKIHSKPPSFDGEQGLDFRIISGKRTLDLGPLQLTDLRMGKWSTYNEEPGKQSPRCWTVHIFSKGMEGG